MQMEEAAHYANEAYKAPNERQVPNLFESVNASYAYTFQHPKYGIVVVHRGTQDPQDFVTDTLLATGGNERLKTTAHYLRAKDYVEHVRAHTGQPVLQIGHSLGGTVAHLLSEELGGESIAFNPGATPKDAPQTATSTRRVYRVLTDPISVSFEGGTVIGARHTDPHTLLNFL